MRDTGLKYIVDGLFAYSDFFKAVTNFQFALLGCSAHYLLGIYSREDLDTLVGSKLPTLNPNTHWEIRNYSGVRTEARRCEHTATLGT